jgi:signal transduction histidine kinase/ABC-type Fe3+ transport system substrate-binding protein
LVIGTTASNERDMQQVFDYFSRQFGVEIITSIGSGTARMDRILAERSRGIFATDIEISGGSSTNRLVEANATQAIMPLLIDRDNVIDRSANWAVNEFLFIDARGMYTPGYTVRADPNMAHIMYNTNNVSPAELETIQSWWDLLEPRWKGRMAAAVDPGFGGGTPQRAFTWMRLGQEWWERFMREMDVALYPPQEPRMLVDDLVRGTVDLVVHIPSNPNKADILEAAALGLPVAEFPRTLREGSIPELYPSVSTMIDRAPHPKAAQLWMNWILSREGQTALHELVDAQEVSLRTDVPQGNVSDQMWEIRSRLIEDPSMLVNVGAYIAVSLARRPGPAEHGQAVLFVDAPAGPSGAGLRRGSAATSELRALLERFLGQEGARKAILQYERAADRDITADADPELVHHVETVLAGAVGTASARVLVESVVGAEPVGLGEVMEILDEASQVRAYSRRLEQKSRELEAATAELREANERLTELDRLKDDFVSTVSHELRTPLTSIRAFSEILRDNPDLTPAQRAEFLNVMVEEAERLTRLINQVLDLSKLESGRTDWAVVDVDLAGAVSDAAAATAHLFDSRGTALDVRGPADGLVVRADRDRLVQVLVNLLANAAKHARGAAGVRLRVASGEGGRLAQVAGRAAAPGPAAAARPARGEPGGQAGIARRAWRDRARSADQPADRRAPRWHAVGGQRAGRGRHLLLHRAADRRRPVMTHRILIVDDEPNIVLSLEFLMRRRGYETRVARTGDEALAAVAEFAPDLVLLDVMLPGPDGFEVAQRLRESGDPAPRIVMLTAKGREAERAKGLAVGADLYVTKPFATRELVDQVARLLDEDG